MGKKRKRESTNARIMLTPPGYGIGARLCPYFSGRSMIPHFGKNFSAAKLKRKLRNKVQIGTTKNTCGEANRDISDNILRGFLKSSNSTKILSFSPMLRYSSLKILWYFHTPHSSLGRKIKKFLSKSYFLETL